MSSHSKLTYLDGDKQIGKDSTYYVTAKGEVPLIPVVSRLVSIWSKTHL